MTLSDASPATSASPPALPISRQLVVVTGAGRGLGVSLARSFLEQGARVVVNYRRSEA